MAKFLSIKELSSSMGVSVSTVNRGIKANCWPFDQYIKIGKRIIYPVSLLDKIEAQSGTAAIDKAKAVVKKRSRRKVK
jgi:hypothetical protein